jgi:hypothetical protein
LSTPSPCISSVQNPWTDFLQEEQAYIYMGLNNDVNQSQYRAMTEEQAAMETQTAGESQNAMDACACSEPQTAKDTSGSKKSKRSNSASMDELFAL